MVEITLIIYSNDKVELACEKNDDVIKVCREIKGRYFNPKNPTWVFPLSELEELKEKLSDHEFIEKTTEASLKEEIRHQFVVIDPTGSGFQLVKPVPRELFIKLTKPFNLKENKDLIINWTKFADFKKFVSKNNFKIRLA